MPRTPEQYEEIRNEKKKVIMDAALKLFASEGFHATSISKIAEEANISKGLLYNYFESKEELLWDIVKKFSSEISEMMNPDNDDIITKEEAEYFIDQYFKMLTTRTEEIKLYYQLTMQPVVNDILHEKVKTETSSKTHLLFIQFFADNGNQHPMEAFLALSAVVKGFGIQYTFSPSYFTNEMIENFKLYIKNLFIHNKL